MTDINYMNDLKVEVQVPTPGLQNLIKNPSGELGAWGWESPVAGTFIGSGTQQVGNTVIPHLDFRGASTSVPTYFQSELLPMSASQYAVARFEAAIISTATIKVSYQWYTSAKVWISGTVQTAAIGGFNFATYFVPAQQAPANAAYVKLRIDVYNTSGGNPPANPWVFIRNVMVAKSSTSTGFGSIRENLFPDPNSTNAATWSSAVSWMPITTSTVAWGYTGGQSTQLRGPDTSDGNATTYAQSTAFPVTAGEYYTSSAYLRGTGYTRTVYLAIQWFVDGAWQGFWYGSNGVTLPSDGSWVRPNIIMRAPAGATQARLIIDGKTFINGEYIYVDGVLVEQTTYAKDYFDGGTTDTATITYDWSGTTNASKSTATVASAGFAYNPPYAWVPITGSVNELTIDREAMNVGLLTVRIKDKLLDPAGYYDPILKPGKQVRVYARKPDNVWQPLFTGKISNAHVEYDKLKKVNAQVESTITISAVDAMADLANQGESRSVAQVYHLPYILEGKGVPWDCDGVTYHYAGTPTIPVVNDNLSIADQVAITRDTDRGYAWVDAYGVLKVVSQWAATWGVGTQYYLTDRNITDTTTSYIANGDFESTGVGPWTAMGGTVARSTSAAKTGTYGMRYTKSGTSAAIVSAIDVPVPGPGVYKLGFDIRYNFADGRFHTGDPTIKRGNGIANAWQTWSTMEMESYMINGSHYVSANVYIEKLNGTVTTGDLVDFDNFTIKADVPHGSYSEIDVDWDTDRIMNQVEIKHLKTNAEGNAEEVPVGTWENATSVSTYGPKKATYTIVGTAPDFTAYANAILSNNATPVVRANSIRVPVKDDVSKAFAVEIDLAGLIKLFFDDKVADTYRVESLKHSINADGWFVDITFATGSSNPAPQYTPAPPVSATDLTNTGWIQPALQNNWGYYAGNGSAWGPLAYRRVNGIVYMRGLITKTVGSTAEGVFQLPVGFRPAYHHMVPMVNNSPDYARMDVQYDGWVVFPAGVPNVAFVSVNTCWVADA